MIKLIISLEGEKERFLFFLAGYVVNSPIFIQYPSKIHSIPQFSLDHLRSMLGVIYRRGAFSVHFGDHLRSGDHPDERIYVTRRRRHVSVSEYVAYKIRNHATYFQQSHCERIR